MKRGVVAVLAAFLVVLGSAGVVVSHSRPAPREAPGVDEDRALPPYPFPSEEKSRAAERLELATVKIELEREPIGRVLEEVARQTGFAIEMDAAVARVASGVNTTWNGPAMNARKAIDGFCHELGQRTKGEPPVPIFLEDRVRLVRQKGSSIAWRNACARQLWAQSAKVNFEGAPLSEFLELIRGFTRRDAAMDPDVNEKMITIACTATGVMGDLLDQVTATAGLTWCLSREKIVIKSRSALREKRVALELRAATVPDLVAALASQDITAVPTREAWNSRGTFSVFARGSLGEALAAVRSATRLSTTVVEEEEGDVLVLDGAVPSVRAALGGPCPDAFRGVRRELDVLREELFRRVAERDALRRGDSRAALLAAERGVHDLALQVGAVSARAIQVDGAPARLEAAKEAEASAAGRSARERAGWAVKQASDDVACRERLAAGAWLDPATGESIAAGTLKE
jgi:hypothetical protein